MSLVLKERVVEVNRPYERNAKAGGTRVVGVVWESLPGRTVSMGDVAATPGARFGQCMRLLAIPATPSKFRGPNHQRRKATVCTLVNVQASSFKIGHGDDTSIW